MAAQNPGTFEAWTGSRGLLQAAQSKVGSTGRYEVWTGVRGLLPVFAGTPPAAAVALAATVTATSSVAVPTLRLSLRGPRRAFWTTSKPPAGTAIDFSHPLAQGLRAAFLLAERAGAPVDSLQQVILGPTASTTWAGEGLLCDGIADGADVQTPLHLQLPLPLTVACLVRSHGGATGSSVLFGASHSNADLTPWQSYQLGINGPSSWYLQGNSAGTFKSLLVAGANAYYATRVALVGVLAAGGWALYVNGNQIGTLAGPLSDPTYGATSRFQIGKYVVADRTPNATVECGLVVARAWSAQEVKLWSGQPYAVFAAPAWARISVLSVVVEPGPIPLAAAVAATSTASAALSVAVQLAAAPAAESAATAALAVAVSLAATVASASTVAGTLTSSVSLSAQCAAVSTATAALSTAVALAAASVAVMAVSGHLSVVQLVRAAADVGAAVWHDQDGGTTNLYAALAEVIANDATYVEGPDATGTPSEQKMRFAAATDPSANTGHILRYRYEKDSADGDTINLTVTLYAADGTTSIASQQHTNITDTVTAGSFTLSGAEADAIPSASYATGLVVGFKEQAA